MGAYHFRANPYASWHDVSQGLFFSVPLLMILLAHELGHYLMCRQHHISATPPYFIPFPPSPLFLIPGTLGAFIRIKQPIPDRAALLEVGAGGPLAGLLVAVPIYIAGLMTSPIVTMQPESEGLIYLGEPLLMRILQYLFVPTIAPGHEIMLNGIAFAGWFGFLVTLINLMPVGQLDGGHICYALFGRHQQRIARIVTSILICLVFFWPGWLLWVLLTRKMTGLNHPPTIFDARPLSSMQRGIGYASIIVVILLFMPAPVSIPEWWENWSIIWSEMKRLWVLKSGIDFFT